MNTLRMNSLKRMVAPWLAAGAVLTAPAYAASTDFEAAISPVTNPVYFDNTLPQTMIRPIYIFQHLSGSYDTTLGKIPVGGDMQVVAIQAEYAVTDTISLVAAKDGYIWFEPDATAANGKGALSKKSGFANLAAGAKWAFWYEPEDQFAMSLRAIFEFPTGNTDVWQGEDYYSAAPAISVIKIWEGFQFNGNFGGIAPFNDSGSAEIFASGHVSYNISDLLFPLLEVNYFHVVDPGNGNARFSDQAGGLVPGIATFEGGDLVNFGASNSSVHRDLVTMGVGFRVRAAESIDVGCAYEFPLTPSSDNLMKNRVTVDVIWSF